MCSKGIYYNVYHFKNKVTIRSGQRDVTVKHVERGSDNEMAGNVMSENQRLSRACIVHLVIKKNNWSYVKTMSCSGSHLGITINIKNTKFVKDLPKIDAQFRFNQCNSFREEDISVFSRYGPVLIL